LIVSLHTWSGDYTQKDPLVEQIMANDWNYIHPDFRGPNYTAEACGSPLVVSDIDDAIDFALQNANVNVGNIHVIGVSGGGYATLLAWMQSRHDVRTFSAWAAISDIRQWYYETKARGLKYAQHIALATTGDSTDMDVEEAKSRSPMFMQTPVASRKNSKLFIYTGVHDGYTGSVPITHSLQVYNKVVQDLNPDAFRQLVPSEVTERLLAARSLPGNHYGQIGGRVIHYRQKYADQLSVTIFEGSHEMLVDEALKHIPGQTILAIGDSNGAKRGGWVDQLKELRSQDHIINVSISGNTVGFVNNGNPELNTLDNMNRYLQQSDPDKKALDNIVILLGTNDCKAVFQDRQDEVAQNYRQLLGKIEAFYQGHEVPQVIMVSPPPYGADDQLAEKYRGAGERVKQLNLAFQELAEQEGHTFVDIHSPLDAVVEYVSPDGVHLTEDGQVIIARIINDAIALSPQP
jgi:lysophospholipase L1-like esterase/pimeloyl-ACP methyl ester carboxylesterase